MLYATYPQKEDFQCCATIITDDWAKDEHTLSTSREVIGTSGDTNIRDKSDDTFTNWESTTLQ